MHAPSLRLTIRKELLSLTSLFVIFCIGLLYIFLAVVLLNSKLLFDTLSQHFPITAQLTILVALFQGILNSMHVWEIGLLMLNAILVGITVLLLIKTVSILEKGKVRVSAGGAALISLVSTGCASCGLSILSLVGLSVTFLPFRGLELRILATGALLFSAAYMLRQLHNAKYCRIN